LLFWSPLRFAEGKPGRYGQEYPADACGAICLSFRAFSEFSWHIRPTNEEMNLTRPSRNQKGNYKNPKFEYRNPKQIPNAKFEIQKGLVWNIEILSLRACLEFRASDLGFLLTSWFEQFFCQLAHNFICKGLIR